MPNFSALLDRLDQKIDSIFCDDAILRPVSGSGDVAVAIQLRFPAEADTLQGASIVRSRPTVRVSVLQVAVLTRGDVFILGGNGWRVAAGPLRPGNGRRWRAEVEPLGPTT